MWGPKKDLHTGFDGDIFHQPLDDLIYLISQLTDKEGNVLIPEFYDNVRILTEEEKEIYKNMEFNIEQYKETLGVTKLKTENKLELLIKKWCQPSLIITTIQTNSTKGSVIPKQAKCRCNIRFVNDQTVDQILKSFTTFVQKKFSEKKTSNQLKINILHTGDAWIGDYNNKYYKIASEAINQVWQQQPLYIKEGGSLPITSFLGRTLKCDVLHLPIGTGNI